MNEVRTVAVNASRKYDVIIGSGIMDDCGKIISSVKKKCRAVIITDSNVDVLYSDRVRSSLENSGFSTEKFVFPAGESSKNTKTFVEILEFLAEKNITRSDLVVALGGGVVGDISGFAASCYLRGIDFVQIPTTLLASVDSSVGGKTAIDLEAGKNLAGAFYQPISVICDTDTYRTLPAREISCGYAEIVKYAVAFDESLFKELVNGEAHISEIVEKCVKLKRNVVEADELDKGERMLLNFGHTAAHGIEKHSGYTLSHGEAVAVGMLLACKMADNLGVSEKSIYNRLRNLLIVHKLPVKYDISAKELCEAALSDKKRNGGEITLVLPEKMGKCVLYKTNVDNLEELFGNAL